MTALARLLAQKPNVRPSVLFGDGDIVMEVVALEPDYVQCLVVAPGLLGSRKGITIREIDMDLDPFPEKDQRDLLFCLAHGIDFLALSFVRTRQDVDVVRAFDRAGRISHEDAIVAPGTAQQVYVSLILRPLVAAVEAALARHEEERQRPPAGGPPG